MYRRVLLDLELVAMVHLNSSWIVHSILHSRWLVLNNEPAMKFKKSLDNTKQHFFYHRIN